MRPPTLVSMIYDVGAVGNPLFSVSFYENTLTVQGKNWKEDSEEQVAFAVWTLSINVHRLDFEAIGRLLLILAK